MISLEHPWLNYYAYQLSHVKIRSLWLLRIDIPEWAFQYYDEED